jgi:hypothetical protein
MTRSKVRSSLSIDSFFFISGIYLQKKGPRKKGRAGSANPDDDRRDDILQKSDMNNEKFEAYYRKQLAMDDDEWCTFLNICRESLPSTFRICGTRECVCSSSPLVPPWGANDQMSPSGRRLCSPL